MTGLWTRLIVWLARKPIEALEARIGTECAEAYKRGWERGVGDAYSLGWNQAMLRMRSELEAARAEIAMARAQFFPLRGGKAERVH